MPKKLKPIMLETRPHSQRAASREALKNLARITDSDDEQVETLEILSDDEVLTIEPPKKKYRVCQKKSSDGSGNERDILVLKSFGCTDAQTLTLEAWNEELSEVQQNMHKQAEKEYELVTSKIEELLKSTGAEIIYEGDYMKLLDVESPVITPISAKTTSKAAISATKQIKSIPAKTQAKSSAVTIVAAPPQPQPISTVPSGYSLVVDPNTGHVVGTVTPTSQTVKPNTRKRTRLMESPAAPPPKITKVTSANNSHPPPLVSLRTMDSLQASQKNTPSSTSIPKVQSNNAVVDLTSDDAKSDTREVSFNKLQGKTFPSLVVVARPSLRYSANAAADRAKLDLKVKSVLMHQPTKFTEWLIQQGLIKSEQHCTKHPANKLKLGMYSDVSKFPFSGGYVWISECCPQKFVSVFNSSFFEGSPHAPSVLLKLIYHWACQTNVQNVIQWVKVENMYVKGLNTWLRSVCTVALHTHIPQLGGIGIEVEIGVISLGTTSQDGNSRQVKVEVLGILECKSKRIRLRAVEPLSDNDRNYKKRFAKILEPLCPWVHPGSIILTDLTVDKSTLQSMGFLNIIQSSAGANKNIMDYLRRIVPRMFQNTLSLLSRQIIQQFLDELVWREWFGCSAAEAFDNILIHLSEQTRVDTGQSIVVRLNKVAGNPFRVWSIKSQLNKENAPAKIDGQKNYDTQKKQRRKQQLVISPSPTPEVKSSSAISPNVPELMVPIENYYYGTIDAPNLLEYVYFNVKCHICKEPFTDNIKLMKHYFGHAHNIGKGYQCYYCLAGLSTKDELDIHIKFTHPSETKIGNEFVCIICELKFPNSYTLGNHMSTHHLPSELPYNCGSCKFRCSSHKEAIDHFHSAHIHQGVLQCPFCLKSTTIATNNRTMPQHLHFFLQHLQKHQRKTLAKKCNKCCLWFIQKDGVQLHLKMHESQRRTAGLRPWSVPQNGLIVPKSVDDYAEEEMTDITNIQFDISIDSQCKECNKKITAANHFPSVLGCSYENCQYVTCCKRAMDKHTEICKISKLSLPTVNLPFEMFCVCGYSSTDGNALAHHLAVCERKSAYPSLEAAKAATVTHSMLDVLGLVRRPEEPSATVENTVDTIDITSDTEMNSEERNSDEGKEKTENSIDAEKVDPKENTEISKEIITTNSVEESEESVKKINSVDQEKSEEQQAMEYEVIADEASANNGEKEPSLNEKETINEQLEDILSKAQKEINTQEQNVTRGEILDEQIHNNDVDGLLKEIINEKTNDISALAD